MNRYRTIVADPPWPLADLRMRPWTGAGGRRRRATKFPYETMTLDAIKAVPVSEWAEDSAHLYLWVPAKLNREGVGVAVAEAWGFEVVSEIVWFKTNFGLGAFPRPQHEIILVCRRGGHRSCLGTSAAFSGGVIRELGRRGRCIQQSRTASWISWRLRRPDRISRCSHAALDSGGTRGETNRSEAGSPPRIQTTRRS